MYGSAVNKIVTHTGSYDMALRRQAVSGKCSNTDRDRNLRNFGSIARTDFWMHITLHIPQKTSEQAMRRRLA